jgi:ABC-type glycerol-3-phosphate transport system permease component
MVPLLSPADGFLPRLRKIFSRWPLHTILIVTALLWMTPAIGLLVSSFRPAADVSPWITTRMFSPKTGWDRASSTA